MVWLVQNCRSNKCMYFLRPPELRGGGVSPWAPYQGSVLEPLGDLKRSPDHSPTHASPNPNPGSTPALDMPICLYQNFLVSFIILYESKNE